MGIGGWGDVLERTTDGGRTWTELRLRLVFQTAVLPTSPTTLVVQVTDTTDYRQYALLASRDRGDTWTRVGDGLPKDVLLVAVVPDLARPGVLFAATQERGIFSSADGGKTWIRTSRPSSSHRSRRRRSAAR